MKAEFRVLACVAAIVCSGLSGCILWVPGVRDVNVVSVDVIKISDEFPWVTLPYDRLQIKVTFSTRRNLFQYVEDYSWLPIGLFYECDNGKVKETPLGPGGAPFWRGLKTWDRVPYYPQILGEMKKSETQIYYTFLDIRTRDIQINHATGKPLYALYDLEKYPLDVCYQLSGSGFGEVWGNFHSNIAPIPKEAVVAAFERAREQADIRPTK